jgi:hypothetical protein
LVCRTEFSYNDLSLEVGVSLDRLSLMIISKYQRIPRNLDILFLCSNFFQSNPRHSTRSELCLYKKKNLVTKPIMIWWVDLANMWFKAWYVQVLIWTDFNIDLIKPGWPDALIHYMIDLFKINGVKTIFFLKK